MSDYNKRHLNSGNLTEFKWSESLNGIIVVREKDTDEIVLTVRHDPDHKQMIAASYYEGLKTGLGLQSRYVEFLEELAAPLMPGFTQDIEQHLSDIKIFPSKRYVIQGKERGVAEHHSYHLFITSTALLAIQSIIKANNVAYPETFYSEAAKIWIDENKSNLDIQPQACPIIGVKCAVFIQNEDQQTFIWLSERTGFRIEDMIYTAIMKQVENMKDKLSEPPELKMAKNLEIKTIQYDAKN